jgi:hypothetical protein
MMERIPGEPTLSIDGDEVRRAVTRASTSFVAVFDKLRRVHAGGGKDLVLDASSATDFLMDAMRVHEAETRVLASGYSSIRWLWMLRRLPMTLFEGSLSTSAPYDMTLAEVLSSTSGLSERPIVAPDGRVSFHFDNVAFKRAATFAWSARLLSQIHRDLRWVGKGAQLSVRRGKFPTIVASPDLRRSVELYDVRNQRADGPFDRAGTPLVEKDRDAGNVILFAGRASGARDRVIPVKSPAGTTDVRLRHLASLLNVEPLRALSERARARGSRPWTIEAEVLLTLLRVFIPMMAELEYGFASLTHYGYLLLGRSRLESLLDRHLPSAVEFTRSTLGGAEVSTSSREFIAALSSIRGASWPLLPGPVVRIDEDRIVLDAVSASGRAGYSFEYPRDTGDVANVRGEQFEYAIQSVIDNSGWAPSPAIAALRGRKLRLAGRDLTDLDAVGLRNGALLAVSCKSAAYTAEYDAGTHAVVRNAASLISESVKKWQAKMAVLQANLRGDNYEINGVDRIIGVVCIPTVIFAHHGPALDEVAPGLFAACSRQELADWLSPKLQRAQE